MASIGLYPSHIQKMDLGAGQIEHASFHCSMLALPSLTVGNWSNLLFGITALLLFSFHKIFFSVLWAWWTRESQGWSERHAMLLTCWWSSSKTGLCAGVLIRIASENLNCNTTTFFTTSNQQGFESEKWGVKATSCGKTLLGTVRLAQGTEQARPIVLCGRPFCVQRGLVEPCYICTLEPRGLIGSNQAGFPKKSSRLPAEFLAIYQGV